jgi:hypothetical protein
MQPGERGRGALCSRGPCAPQLGCLGPWDVFACHPWIKAVVEISFSLDTKRFPAKGPVMLHLNLQFRPQPLSLN